MTLTHRWRTTSAALIAGLGLAACTAQPDEPIEIGSAATPITTTTPTLSQRDQAVEDAKKTFINFIRRYDELGHAGGSEASAAKVRDLLVPGSPADKDVLNTAQAYRELPAKTLGWAKVSRIKPAQASLTQKELKLSACIDSTKASGSVKNKSPQPASIRFQEMTVHLTHEQDTWLISAYTDIKEVSTC